MSTSLRTALFIGSSLLGATLASACGGASKGDTPDATNAGADAAPPDAVPGNYATIPLSTPDGSFYTAMITVGTQVFAVDVDTGSTTTGIASSACTSCGVTPLYAPGGTATDDHSTASTVYADNTRWSGEIYTDNLGFANGTPSVPVALVGITAQKGFFSGNEYQGIMGLGPDELLENNTTSYLTAAVKAGLSPVLGFEMCPDRGTMWLGGFDPAAASAAPQFTPMLPIDGNNNPYYAVELDDLGLGGTSLGFGASTFQDPIVDTGTSLTYFPTSAFDALMTKVNTSTGFTTLFPSQTLSDSAFPPDYGCVTTAGVTAAQVDAALPPLTYTFPAPAGGTFTVNVPATLSYIYQGGPGQFCLAVGDGGKGSLLGDTFLQAFVTVFDIPGARMGFAPDAGCSSGHAARIARIVAEVGPLREHGHPPHRLR